MKNLKLWVMFRNLNELDHKNGLDLNTLDCRPKLYQSSRDLNELDRKNGLDLDTLDCISQPIHVVKLPF